MPNENIRGNRFENQISENCGNVVKYTVSWSKCVHTYSAGVKIPARCENISRHSKFGTHSRISQIRRWHLPLPTLWNLSKSEITTTWINWQGVTSLARQSILWAIWNYEETHGLPMYAIAFQSKENSESPNPLLNPKIWFTTTSFGAIQQTQLKTLVECQPL